MPSVSSPLRYAGYLLATRADCGIRYARREERGDRPLVELGPAQESLGAPAPLPHPLSVQRQGVLGVVGRVGDGVRRHLVGLERAGDQTRPVEHRIDHVVHAERDDDELGVEVAEPVRVVFALVEGRVGDDAAVDDLDGHAPLAEARLKDLGEGLLGRDVEPVGERVADHQDAERPLRRRPRELAVAELLGADVGALGVEVEEIGAVAAEDGCRRLPRWFAGEAVTDLDDQQREQDPQQRERAPRQEPRPPPWCAHGRTGASASRIEATAARFDRVLRRIAPTALA